MAHEIDDHADRVPRDLDLGRVSEPITSLSSRQMGRSLGALYTAGALMAIAWVILPHVDRSGDPVVLAMAGVALVFGLAMLLGVADSWPVLPFHGIIALIQVIITIGYVAGGEPAGDLRLFYLWATPYAVFFFSSRAAALHTGWVAVCMTAALAILHPPLGDGLSIWLMTLGTVAAVWSVVAWATRGMRDGELRLRYAATHDALTGLPNRVLFLSRCTEALERVRVNGGRVIVLIVDLDRFKVVNDTFGHHAGDALLSVVAPRMHNAVRAGDTVARLGGDEFAVVIEDVHGTVDPEVVAGHLADALSEPVRTDQLVLYTSGGIGHATSSSADDTAISLLRDADAAMYRAKAQGPGRIAAFDGVMRVEARDRAILEGHLRTAHERGEIDIVYQPAIDLETGRIVGAEALLRWTNDELGPIGPAEFVPLAEETGLIVEIGAWVLDEAAAALRAWTDAGAVDARFTMAVNVSAVQLGEGLVELAQRTLAAYDLAPEQLAVELTETSLIGSLASAIDVLLGLKRLGVAVVLDDFGTGYSSLSYLQTIALDALKIDRSFVAGLGVGDRDASIVTAIVNMGRAFGLEVIAEGVETEAQEKQLLAIGCHRAQGYRYSEPVPADVFLGLLRS